MKKLKQLCMVIVFQYFAHPAFSMPTMPELTPSPAPLPDLAAISAMPTAASTPDPLALPPLPPITPPQSDPLAPQALALPTPTTPEAPTSVPMPLPLPAPTVQPLPAPLPAPVPAPLPATAAPIDTNKKNLDLIVTEIETVARLKDTLKSQLSEIDTRLIQAQKDIASAKKLSFELLGKGDDTLAQASIEKIHQSLKNIKNSQLEIETKVSQGFSKTVNDIQNHMTSIQNQIKVLEMSTPAPAVTVPPAVITPTAQGPLAIPATTTDGTKLPTRRHAIHPPKTLIHHIFSKIADLVSGAINLIISIFSGVKEMIAPSTPSIDFKASIITDEGLKKKVPSSPLATAPTATPAIDSATPKNLVALSADVQASIASMDEIVKKLDAQKLAVKKMFGDVKDKSQTLQQQLSKNPELQKNVTQPVNIEEKSGIWKRKAQDLFAAFLDTVEQATSYAQESIVSSYNSLAKLTSKVAKDVKAKVLDSDETKNEDKK
jgi:hypothetical protein